MHETSLREEIKKGKTRTIVKREGGTHTEKKKIRTERNMSFKDKKKSDPSHRTG